MAEGGSSPPGAPAAPAVQDLIDAVQRQRDKALYDQAWAEARVAALERRLAELEAAAEADDAGAAPAPDDAADAG